METALVHLTLMMRRMKMSAVCTVTLLLLSCSAFTPTDAECDYYAALGGSQELQSFSWNKLDGFRLRWMHNSKKVYDSAVGAGNEYDVDDKGSLLLKKVKKDHGGNYVSEVMDQGTLKGKKNSQVCIIENISTPEVTSTCSSSSVTFNCTMNKMYPVTYQWLEGDKILQDQVNPTLVRRSNQLSGNSFSCKVSISTMSWTSRAVKQDCLKLEKKTLFGLDFWLMVGILAGGGGLVLVLIVATIICCTKANRKKRKQGEEEQELRLGWSNTQQQQHPHPHHPHNQHHHRQPQHQHQQQQPAGHTGPRQQRPKQPRPRPPQHGNEYPQPSPRRPPQTSRPAIGVDEEKPPPLPQPRKKTSKM